MTDVTLEEVVETPVADVVVEPVVEVMEEVSLNPMDMVTSVEVPTQDWKIKILPNSQYELTSITTGAVIVCYSYDIERILRS